MASDDDSSSLVAADSDEDIDWEEIDVSQPAEQQNIEITLQARPKQKQDKSDKKKNIAHQERLIRIACHKIHTVCLLGNARVRNKWINDELLHARLLSLTPLALQNAFAVIHRSRVADANQRGRLFESAIERLTEWWCNSFFSVEPVGHIRSRTFNEVQKMIEQLPPLGEQDTLDVEALEDEEECEILHTSKSLMKHALMRGGSRDVSAQLFTSLCRALGIPARLVVSLQSVPWQAGVGKPKPKSSGKKKDAKGKGKEKALDDENGEEDEEDNDMEAVDIPSTTVDVKGKGKMDNGAFMVEGRRLDGKSVNNGMKGKEKAKPVIRLRKQKSKGNVLGSSSSAPPRRETTPDPTTTPPVFWTEVFSRADARWLPVDPIRCIVNKRKMFDPTPSTSTSVRQENRMVYVVAFEEDGYGRDVTPRYAREYGAKVAKVQGGSTSRKEWWERVANLVRRPYRLHRDDQEDEELQLYQVTEGMPTSMAGFKDHPLYVLARHLRHNETIHPLVEIGKFRGEPVYPRSSVVSLKAAENWMRSGRKIREGCQPMKWVKQRASTVNRRREIEMALEKSREKAGGEPSSSVGEEEVMQGLYSESQTELYRPEPIIDGKIPKNDFGNIDLYVPSMLPPGGAHIPFKGVAKIARKLGLDYAEAVIGFEFKKRRALPIIEGVVVAAENEAVLLEAYWEAEQEAESKAQTKREERVIKRWTRLVHGLRLRQRLQEQYANKPQTEERRWLDNQVHTTEADEADNGAPEAGGYLTAADDVVQAFHLPKYQHVVAAYSSDSPSSRSGQDKNTYVIHNKTETSTGPHIPQEQDDDVEMDIPQLQPRSENGVPLTMRELADTVRRRRSIDGSIDDSNRPASSLLTNDGLTVDNTKSAKSTKKSTRPAKTISKPRDSARKRPRDESEHPVLNTPTRVLRPRASKSAAQIQEEREREHAYRRAIAE